MKLFCSRAISRSNLEVEVFVLAGAWQPITDSVSSPVSVRGRYFTETHFRVECVQYSWGNETSAGQYPVEYSNEAILKSTPFSLGTPIASYAVSLYKSWRNSCAKVGRSTQGLEGTLYHPRFGFVE